MKYEFFDQVLEAVENLSPEQIADGCIGDYAYFAGTRVKTWEISADQMRIDLVQSAVHAGANHDDAVFEINEGLHDGQAAICGYDNDA